MGRADQLVHLAGCSLLRVPSGQDQAWQSQPGVQRNPMSSEVDWLVPGPCSEASWEYTGKEAEGCPRWMAGSRVKEGQREGVEEGASEEVWLQLEREPLSQE